MRTNLDAILKKLLAVQASLYRRSNVVKSQQFSQRLKELMNRYINGLLSNEEVIAELMKMAQDIRQAHQLGQQLGLSQEELAFYDALTKPQPSRIFMSMTS